jgi:hypothetical protein
MAAVNLFSRVHWFCDCVLVRVVLGVPQLSKTGLRKALIYRPSPGMRNVRSGILPHLLAIVFENALTLIAPRALVRRCHLTVREFHAILSQTLERMKSEIGDLSCFIDPEYLH